MSTILPEYFCSRWLTPIFTRTRCSGGPRRYTYITQPSPLPIARRGNDNLRSYSTTSNPPSIARPVKMPSSKEGAGEKKPAVPRPSSRWVVPCGDLSLTTLPKLHNRKGISCWKRQGKWNDWQTLTKFQCSSCFSKEWDFASASSANFQLFRLCSCLSRREPIQPRWKMSSARGVFSPRRFPFISTCSY